MSDKGRLQMRLTSKRALRQYKKHMKVTNAEFAAGARCSEASIAFLLSEKKSARNTIGFEAAKRIEEFLDVPPGLLFVPEIVVPLSRCKVADVRPVGRRVSGGRRLVSA